MSVLYRLSKVTSPKAKGYGKWYPRAVITQTVDTEMLATIMQRNCTYLPWDRSLTARGTAP